MARDEYFVPCPLCGAAMRLRESCGRQFWGCSLYPPCRGTRNCDEARELYRGRRHKRKTKPAPQRATWPKCEVLT
ncbi:MAG: topoisomerase DNA-binding C4 zinc finger domain-containing protein [Phycisphaerae bacterium]|nr:topoisomerase DNA-binding C4 zinc finger domain-containing protein [Phycisphaerae bacterium]